MDNVNNNNINTKYRKYYKLLLIGPKQVGKGTLVEIIKSNKFVPQYTASNCKSF